MILIFRPFLFPLIRSAQCISLPLFPPSPGFTAGARISSTHPVSLRKGGLFSASHWNRPVATRRPAAHCISISSSVWSVTLPFRISRGTHTPLTRPAPAHPSIPVADLTGITYTNDSFSLQPVSSRRVAFFRPGSTHSDCHDSHGHLNKNKLARPSIAIPFVSLIFFPPAIHTTIISAARRTQTGACLTSTLWQMSRDAMPLHYSKFGKALRIASAFSGRVANRAWPRQGSTMTSSFSAATNMNRLDNFSRALWSCAYQHLSESKTCT